MILLRLESPRDIMMIKDYAPSQVTPIVSGDAVQSMVHDLRTPMTVIKGNLQLLLSGIMGRLSDEQLTLIQRSIGPLEELILMTENLLQASSMEKSGFSLKLEPTELDKLLSDTIDFYSTAFKQREMQIYRHGNTFGTKLCVDAHWMRRVLSNLIWNAYKFTPDHGKVMVYVRHSGDDLELVVEDNGRGIPPRNWPPFSTNTRRLPLTTTASWEAAWAFGSASASWRCMAAPSAPNPNRAKAAASF